MDDSLTQEYFQELFQAMLEVYGKHDRNGALASLYYDCLVAIKPNLDEYTEAMCEIINNPPEKMPSAADIKGLIRQKRKVVYLPSAREATIDVPKNPDLEQVRENRIAFLRGIYKHQGDTPFYRDALAVRCGIFSQIVTNALLQSGFSLSEIAVTHQDVLESIAEKVGARR